MNLSFRQQGFTIVELLVVIVVIGILASVTLATFGNVKGQARDTRRLSDMQSITTALDLYKTNNGAYPQPTSVNGSWEESSEDNPGDFMEYLQSSGTISQQAPVDPVNTTAVSYMYYVYPVGSYSCDPARGAYYVLAVRDMDTSGRPHPKSPGFSCSGRNWSTEFDWVTGQYEK